MRIGVNVSCLNRRLTGIGFYTDNILKAIIPRSQHDWVLYSDLPLTDPFYKEQSNITIVTFGKQLKLSNLIHMTFFLPRYLLKDKIDIFWSPVHGLPFFKPKKIKYVVTIQDSVYKYAPKTMPKIARWKESILHPLAVNRADKIIVPGNTIKNELMRVYKMSGEKIVSIPHAVTPQENIDDSKIMGAKKYILAVGTKEPRKNFQILLAAYKNLPTALQKKYTLVFCGGRGWLCGSFYDELEKMQASGINIKNYDYVTNRERDNLYRNASLLVMPSIYEGFGLPLIEAMACGIPILASDISIFQEVAGDAAVYFGSNNLDELKRKLADILSDEVQLENLRKKSKKHAQYYLGWERPARETLDVLNTI